jgi:hypothetical protein
MYGLCLVAVLGGLDPKNSFCGYVAASLAQIFSALRIYLVVVKVKQWSFFD